ASAIGTIYSTNAMVLQQDGKIVIAGGDYTTGDLIVQRFNTDGSPDNSFGNGGMRVGDVEDMSQPVVALQGDGKIVVACSSGGAAKLVRYKTDGTLDPSFGSGGEVTNADNTVTSVNIISDGKILIGGQKLTRFNPDGSIDLSFGDAGYVPLNFFSKDLALAR